MKFHLPNGMPRARWWAPEVYCAVLSGLGLEAGYVFEEVHGRCFLILVGSVVPLSGGVSFLSLLCSSRREGNYQHTYMIPNINTYRTCHSPAGIPTSARLVQGAPTLYRISLTLGMDAAIDCSDAPHSIASLIGHTTSVKTPSQPNRSRQPGPVSTSTPPAPRASYPSSKVQGSRLLRSGSSGYLPNSWRLLG